MKPITSVNLDDEFPAKFVAGIVAHINDDHRAEMLAIAHALAGQTWATEATLQHANKRGLDLVLKAGERVELVRVAFDAPLKKTTDFRSATVKLVERAQAKLK
jgi:putative heme iron utilization protein